MHYNVFNVAYHAANLKKRESNLMIKSMTGFGRSEIQQGAHKFTVEMKSVNHRYFDVNIRMPKKLNFFEAAIRGILKEYIQRGKVDVFISYEDLTETNVSLKYNEAVAAQYVRYHKQMAETFGIPFDLTVSGLGRCPEVFTMEEEAVDEDEIWTALEKALREACISFSETRQREGSHLAEDLLDKLQGMEEQVQAVEERYPAIMAEYREKLETKVAELLGDTQAEEGRIAAEVVLYADKICTDEETVRLRSHIQSARKELTQGGAVGRKLDFIAQEMNREANTILSKANDLFTSDTAINLKTEIEKVREQIQNIE